MTEAAPIFTGRHTDSISWSADRQDEALSILKSLRIRPSRLAPGYCQVSYESYAKLRQAGILFHWIEV